MAVPLWMRSVLRGNREFAIFTTDLEIDSGDIEAMLRHLKLARKHALADEERRQARKEAAQWALESAPTGDAGKEGEGP